MTTGYFPPPTNLGPKESDFFLPVRPFGPRTRKGHRRGWYPVGRTAMAEIPPVVPVRSVIFFLVVSVVSLPEKG